MPNANTITRAESDTLLRTYLLDRPVEVCCRQPAVIILVHRHEQGLQQQRGTTAARNSSNRPLMSVKAGLPTPQDRHMQ